MNPDDYQRTRKHLLARIETLREVRDDLAARDPLLVGEFPADVRWSSSTARAAASATPT